MRTKLVGTVLMLLLVGITAATIAGVGKGLKSKATVTLDIDYDSTGDTTALGYSYSTTVVGLTNNMKDYDAAVGRVYIADGSPALRGTGLVDSLKMVLCTSLQGLERRLDSATLGAFPGSLYFSFSADTLFYHDLYLEVTLIDSTTDTAFDRDYDMWWDIIVKGD
jgi:hypothetical protein